MTGRHLRRVPDTPARRPLTVTVARMLPPPQIFAHTRTHAFLLPSIAESLNWELGIENWERKRENPTQSLGTTPKQTNTSSFFLRRGVHLDFSMTINTIYSVQLPYIRFPLS